MRAKHLSLLAIMMVTMLGCNRKPSVVQSFMSSAEADTLSEHIYEHGIPIDMYSVEEGVVENGDYFSVIMEKLGVPQTTTNDLISATRKVFDVKDLRVGNSYHAYYEDDTTGNDDQRLAYLVYEQDPRSVVVFCLKDTLSAYVDKKEMVTKTLYNEVVINNSLWYDTQKAGCSPLLAVKMADMYAWTIDFFGLQKGDSYKALYEVQECDGKVMDVSKVLYSSFTHNGKEHQLYYFDTGEKGTSKYWNEKGESMKKSFLKAPLKYSRISSGFSYARRHPVTRRVQPHTGVDYAAPKGTPVVSVSDGVVQSAKYEGAGGNTVRIKHDRTYRTAYLHLSKFAKGIRAGAHVTQGQVIGYVGSTGRSTGPHLDFRIWEKDKPVNPLKMITPPAEPLTRAQMVAFNAAREAAFAKRDSIWVREYYQKTILDKLSISAAAAASPGTDSEE